MKKLFEIIMVISFLACICLAECIPACLGCFALSLVCGLIVYGMEMWGK